MAIKEKAEEIKTMLSFTKGQILAAKKYADRRDLLTVLLSHDKQYTHAEVEKVMGDFMKKGVK